MTLCCWKVWTINGPLQSLGIGEVYCKRRTLCMYLGEFSSIKPTCFLSYYTPHFIYTGIYILNTQITFSNAERPQFKGKKGYHPPPNLLLFTEFWCLSFLHLCVYWLHQQRVPLVMYMFGKKVHAQSKQSETYKCHLTRLPCMCLTMKNVTIGTIYWNKESFQTRLWVISYPKVTTLPVPIK